MALTTWQALTIRAKLQPGEHVMIQAGSGGRRLVCHPARQAHRGDRHGVRKRGQPGVDARSGGGPHHRLRGASASRTPVPFDVVYDGACGPLVERGCRYPRARRALRRYRRHRRCPGLPGDRDVRGSGRKRPAARIQPFIAQAGGARRRVPRAVDAARRRAARGDRRDHRCRWHPARPSTATYALDAVAAAYDALSVGHTRGKLVVTI